MNDKTSVLEKLVSRRTDTDGLEDDANDFDDLGAFGWLRGVRDRALMLELRRRDGSALALGYAWLERAEFDPSEGITLCFGGKTVRITGRNLDNEARPN